VITVSIAVEGASDVAAVEKMLASRGISVDPKSIFVKRGHGNLDKKLTGSNNGAARSPWFVLRDTDRDDCPAALRERLLPDANKNPGMCFRLAVRSIEAWLLADMEAFAKTFSVTTHAIPSAVEELINPKESLVNICRGSRKSLIRSGIVPPPGSRGRVGPEYVTYIADYARTAWRPDIAATNAPSLARALREIDRLVSDGIWK
jgi:hypothetical protein